MIDRHFGKTHQLVGPLHCVPVVVKDNVDSFDSPSTSGSLALLGSQPVKDAFLVARLRDAGALILGKGAMDELAMGMHGYSSRNGRIGNVYDTTKNSGGSSGGSSVAVSANFAMVGIGTDNSGSVRVPAVFNGVVGLRPSAGLISLTGVFPHGNLDGVAGPIARTVVDLALVLDAIAAVDRQDKMTEKQHRPQSYVQQLQKIDLHGKRFGIIRSVAGKQVDKDMTDDAQKVYQAFYQQLRRQGALIDEIDLPDFDVNRRENRAGSVESVNAYLKAFPSTRRNWAEICTSGRVRGFGGEAGCLEDMKEIAKKDSEAYRQVKARFIKNRRYVEHVMKEHNYFALLSPITRKGIADYDPSSVVVWQLPVSSNSGLPALGLPIGNIGKNPAMPVGVQITGHFYDEISLLNIGYTLESMLGSRIVPTLPQPDSDTTIMQASIPELNNLITQIGAVSTEKVKSDLTPDTLTFEKFTKIVRSVKK